MRKTFFKRFILVLLASAISFSGFCQASAESPARISLDLKGMDVVEVLKTLAAKGNLNLIVGSDIRGRVTMFLKDVEPAEAFEIILAANNLASERRGDIVYVMTQKDYELLYGEKYGDKKLAKMIQLKYAKAVLIGELLNQIKTNIGKVMVDEGSNSVIIIDTPKSVSRVVDFVQALDKPTDTVVLSLTTPKPMTLNPKLKKP